MVPPLGNEHIEALQLRIKAPVRQGYGLTETTAGCIYQKVGISPSGSTGVLISNMECKLVNEEGAGGFYIHLILVFTLTHLSTIKHI